MGGGIAEAASAGGRELARRRRTGIAVRTWNPRYAHASGLLTRSTEIQVVKAGLGHGSIITTQGYLHTLPNADETALKAVDAIRGTRTATPTATERRHDHGLRAGADGAAGCAAETRRNEEDLRLGSRPARGIEVRLSAHARIRVPVGEQSLPLLSLTRAADGDGRMLTTRSLFQASAA